MKVSTKTNTDISIISNFFLSLKEIKTIVVAVTYLFNSMFWLDFHNHFEET